MKDADYDRLLKRIDNGNVKAGVVGLGYAGLPLAMAIARQNMPVVGHDINHERIQALLSGNSYIADVASEEVQCALNDGMFTAEIDPRRLREADILHICVPTPLSKSKEPDMSHVLSATQTIARLLRRGQLVVLESTTYPGATEELLLPSLEESGLTAGRDFFLAYSPERIDPGNRRYRLSNTPKIVGGVTRRCAELASRFYNRFIEEVVQVSSTGAAEMTKLLENTFRSVNIALANEMSLVCDRLGLDVWEVIDAAATKPFGFMPFYPGPGLGGHCIPVDPHYLAWRAREFQFHSRFIELASEINGSMPEHVANKVNNELNERQKSIKGSQALLLGAAYKSDVADVRESPAIDVMTLLLRQGAQLVYHDPNVPVVFCENKRFDSYENWPQLLDSIDIAVILTKHRAIDYSPLLDAPCPVIDTRGVLRELRASARIQ